MLVFIVHALPLSRRTFLLWIWTLRTRSCAMFSMFRMLHETFPLALSVVPCVDISWTPGMICCRRRPAGRKENFSSISPSRSARPSILCVYLFSQISLALSVFCSAWGVSKYWNKNFTDHVNSDESWARYQTRLFFLLRSDIVTEFEKRGQSVRWSRKCLHFCCPSDDLCCRRLKSHHPWRNWDFFLTHNKHSTCPPCCARVFWPFIIGREREKGEKGWIYVLWVSKTFSNHPSIKHMKRTNHFYFLLPSSLFSVSFVSSQHSKQQITHIAIEWAARWE